jgi:hypothetical protein
MPLSGTRSIRYRRLAVAAKVRADADLLLKLADECDRGLLCVADWRSALPSFKKEQPPKVGNARARFEGDPFFEWEPISSRTTYVENLSQTPPRH